MTPCNQKCTLINNVFNKKSTTLRINQKCTLIKNIFNIVKNSTLCINQKCIYPY